MKQLSRSTRPWSPERPRTLVVCCSDGRWHSQIQEFVGRDVDERADLYAVPGGPAVVDPWTSTFDEARAFEAAMRLFLEHHALSSIWLLGHQGCAYYKLRHPHLDEEAREQRMVEDLGRAALRLGERWPGLELRRIVARREGALVSFVEPP